MTGHLKGPKEEPEPVEPVCKICNITECYMGTTLCKYCYDLSTHIAYNPEAARKILKGYPDPSFDDRSHLARHLSGDND